MYACECIYTHMRGPLVCVEVVTKLIINTRQFDSSWM